MRSLFESIFDDDDDLIPEVVLTQGKFGDARMGYICNVYHQILKNSQVLLSKAVMNMQASQLKAMLNLARYFQRRE